MGDQRTEQEIARIRRRLTELVSDEMIDRHLRGEDGAGRHGADFVAGVYPLLDDETCWFVAAPDAEVIGNIYENPGLLN